MIELGSQDKKWIATNGRLLNWTVDEYVSVKETIYRDGVNSEGMTNLRRYCIEGITDTKALYQNLKSVDDVYARLGGYIDDKQLLDIAYDIAFTEVSGILSLDEINRILQGKYVSEQALTTFPPSNEQLSLN